MKPHARIVLLTATCVGCGGSAVRPGGGGNPADLGSPSDSGGASLPDGGDAGAIDGGADGGFDPALAATLQSVLDAQVKSQSLMGATLGVAIAGHGTFVAASGFKDAARTTPIVPSDRFRIGSITKTFTGAVIMQLVEQGVVKLDDPLERWSPGFPSGNQITIRQLMGHTSGIYDFLQDPSFDRSARHQHIDMVNVAAQHASQFTTPGSAWAYSNTNFILLGLVIEAATHTTYAASVASRLFMPLGLGDTFLDDDPSTLAYVRGFALQNGQWVDVTARDSASVAWSAGAVVANAQDLLAWIGALSSGHVVSTASWTQMTTPTTIGGQAQPYGLALMIDLRAPSHPKYGHDGAISGYESDVRVDPQRGIAICALTNTDGADATKLADAAWAVVAK